MIDLPDSNFEKVYIDFLGTLPTGELLLVLVDVRSRYPMVEILRKNDASTAIPQLDKIFALFGLPDEVVTDNGPPFQGKDIRNFMCQNGIHHRKMTPLWPQINEQKLS